MAPAPSAEELAALRQKYPGAKVFTCMEQTFVGRKPNRMEYKRFRKLLLEAETRAIAHESLLPCIIFPDAAKLNEVLEEYPVLEVTLGNALLELIGNEAKVEKKES